MLPWLEQKSSALGRTVKHRPEKRLTFRVTIPVNFKIYAIFLKLRAAVIAYKLVITSGYKKV